MQCAVAVACIAGPSYLYTSNGFRSLSSIFHAAHLYLAFAISVACHTLARANATDEPVKLANKYSKTLVSTPRIHSSLAAGWFHRQIVGLAEAPASFLIIFLVEHLSACIRDEPKSGDGALRKFSVRCARSHLSVRFN